MNTLNFLSLAHELKYLSCEEIGGMKINAESAFVNMKFELKYPHLIKRGYSLSEKKNFPVFSFVFSLALQAIPSTSISSLLRYSYQFMTCRVFIEKHVNLS